MNKKLKRFLNEVKDFREVAGSCVKEFASDTKDYVEEHPIVISIVGIGFLKTLAWGIELANKSCIDVNKNGVSDIFIGDKYTKLNKSMNLQDWFDYLEEMYKCNFKRKKQKTYLRSKGFID